jgi:pimeloyl-ACP methyl ester carboxylesterase
VPGPRVQCARTVDGLCIAYQVVGDGPFDLVYAPGWISNLECVWEMPDLGDFLRRLAGMARLILLDRRGTGLSDRPFTSESLSLEAGMDDVRAVMDAAGSERAVLFGVEDGAAVCSLYAASYPDRVRALVLFSVIAAHGWTEDFPWSWTDETYRAWVARVEHEWGTEGFWSGVPNPVSPRLADDPDRVRAWARYARLSASPGTALALERAFYELDVRAVLPAIRVPTLVLHRIDNSFVAVGQARYASEHIPGARLVELPGDEHSPFMGNVGDRGWRTLLERHDATVRALLGRYRGTEVDTAGDGFFARFDGPGRAIRCAQAIVEARRAARHRASRRRPYGRDRAVRWQGRRHRRAHRRPSRRARRAVGGSRVLNREGPHGRLGDRVRGRRRARAQGHLGAVASLPGRESERINDNFSYYRRSPCEEET